MAQQYVDRFNTVERVLHWIVAISFFVLLLSGLGLFSRTFFSYFALFGGPQHGILFHKGAGIVFLVSSVLLFIRLFPAEPAISMRTIANGSPPAVAISRARGRRFPRGNSTPARRCSASSPSWRPW